MPKHNSDFEKDKIRRMRRARKARVLPRSGAGPHAEYKKNKLEKILETESEEAIREALLKTNEDEGDEIDEDLLDSLEDLLDDETCKTYED